MVTSAWSRAENLAVIDSASFRAVSVVGVVAALLAGFTALGWIFAQPMLGIVAGVTAIGTIGTAHALLGGSRFGASPADLLETHAGRFDG